MKSFLEFDTFKGYYGYLVAYYTSLALPQIVHLCVISDTDELAKQAVRAAVTSADEVFRQLGIEIPAKHN